ncbi:MAG: hypothetical protein F4X72_12160 [Dehalococcoidia bacterium]|nr:hypothetical protein [Dehalococcoidia bacterium]
MILLAGLTAGAIAAVIVALVSLPLHSPVDSVFNSATVSIAAIAVGLIAGLLWMRLSVRIMWYGISLAGLFIIVLATALAGESVLDRLASFTIPLAAIAIIVCAVLTPLLANFFVRPELGLLKWSPVPALIVALVLGFGLITQGDAESGDLALPPPPSRASTLTADPPSPTVEPTSTAMPVATTAAPTVEPTSTAMPVATTAAPTVEPTSTAMPVATTVTATVEPTSTAMPVATTVTATVEPTSTAMPVATTVTATVEPTSTAMPVATPVAATATATLEPVATPAEAGGETAEEGFIIGEGSKITFTVEEELRGSPVRFDAVMSSTGLSGTANLDGQPSVVTLDLHSLTSDQSFRDRYVRDRMFPNTPKAVVIVEDLPDLPQSFFEGAEFTGQLQGSLQIGETVTPLVFDVTARHDGDVINVLGLTTFTWEQLGIITPTARSVVYLADEVRVQVLLVAHAP